MSQRGVLNSVDADSSGNEKSEAQASNLEGISPAASPVPSIKMLESLQIHNDRSFPYEPPQLPIEQIEKKMKIQKQLSRVENKGEEREESLEQVQELRYQKVSIIGEETSGVPPEDLLQASRHLVEAMQLRENYMKMSYQSFAKTPARFLNSFRGESESKIEAKTETSQFFCTECRRKVKNRYSLTRNLLLILQKVRAAMIHVLISVPVFIKPLKTLKLHTKT